MTGAGVVIAGAGQAGFQAALSLRDQGYDGRITLVGDEAHPPYQRPPLSKAFLGGEMAADTVLLRPPGAYAGLAIDLLLGQGIGEIGAGRVALHDGAQLAYDHLILALGARNRALAVPGAGLQGVVMLRTLDEAAALRDRLAEAAHVVVIGAGFIGLEVAAAVSSRGCPVHVIEVAPRAMARATSAPVSQYFSRRHARQGVHFLFDTGVTRLVGRAGRVVGVEIAGGATIAADLVVVGIGVTPNVALAQAHGLRLDGGIAVDSHLLTSDPAISAIGDCAAFPDRRNGGRVRLESVQNAVDQARCVAARLVGRAAPYAAVPWFWSDQGQDRLQIAGLTGSHDQVVLRGDPESGAFSAFCFRQGRFLGVESANRPGDHMTGRRLLGQALALSPDQAGDPAFDLKAYAAGHRVA